MLIIWIIMALGVFWFTALVEAMIEEEFGKAALLFSPLIIFGIVYELFIKVV